jgi:CTP synthase (UTP-ammonia lyase)
MAAPLIRVLMDLPPTQRYHVATLAAIDHAAVVLGLDLDVQVLTTDALGNPADLADTSAAIVVGPGSPYRDPEAVLTVIRLARERGIPLVGT